MRDEAASPVLGTEAMAGVVVVVVAWCVCAGTIGIVGSALLRSWGFQ